jgi:DNA gyrase/topoisomerase IV subunit A
MTRFALSQIQAQAILDMRLRRIASLERQKIDEEYAQLSDTIARLQALLADPQKVLATVREETLELKRKFGQPRLTEIQSEEARFRLRLVLGARRIQSLAGPLARSRNSQTSRSRDENADRRVGESAADGGLAGASIACRIQE